jgi:Tol biopolymer transport system component
MKRLGVLTLTLVIPCSTAAQPVTLEGLLSAPFPSEIVAAPVGGHVAWVQNARGSRNVWVTTAPDFKSRQLTTYTGDDGQEITGVSWSADGKTVLYVRGGAPNRQNEIPNPSFMPDPPEQAIWAVDIAAGSPRKLGVGAAASVSSNGRVVYVAKGQVWSTDLSGSQKPAQLFTIRGQARDLRWSPDGKRLAFVSARGDHSFVGVYELETRSLRYLDPSVDLDANIAWSPDGTRIAFTRVPNLRENMSFAPRREGEPWSIRTVDVASGRGTEIWKADRGPGSVFQGVSADSQLEWVSGDRIVFPWERDGWIHLYSVPASGGKADLLTPGAF